MAKQDPERETVQTQAIQWDTEQRVAVGPKEGHVRDDIMYLTSALLGWMEELWGGVLTHVKTSTDVATGEVTVARAEKGEPGATSLRRTGALNTGEFSFWRPLFKLNMKVPPARQFNVTPFTREVAGLGTVFVFPMNERVSVPRNRKEERAAAEAARQARTEAAPSTGEE